VRSCGFEEFTVGNPGFLEAAQYGFLGSWGEYRGTRGNAGHRVAMMLQGANYSVMG
jgi:hypothetical protein